MQGKTKELLHQLQGVNAIASLTKDNKKEVTRILRKSRDFRTESEVQSTLPYCRAPDKRRLHPQLETLRDLMEHLDFPANIRSPGINVEEEVCCVHCLLGKRCTVSL
jgi:hypothetical protein